ncbi:MAG: DUF4435 domain-containing protein [Paraprevotella sp.]|jgi:hypothetical protein|nr:DUF4435 domain-containing protein [Paraprevotella sp.]
MAKRLADNLNSLYIGAANKLKPKDARQKIVAYVESYADISFWRMVLDEFEDETRYFEIMLPSRSSLGKGKKLALMNQLGSHLGNYMIACVDADYDYLMQGVTPTSRMVNNHPYVFHTYAYAIENYLCYAGSLHQVCVMATLNDRQLVDLEEFMKQFSLIIWPLFVWSVWMYRNDKYREFTLTEFGNHVSFSDINVYHPENTLEYVKKKVNRKIAWLQRQYPQAKKDYESLKQEIIGLGVTPETTYLYMQGHTLFDNVITPLLEPICTILRREREREIKELADHDTQRQNEWSCYMHSQTPVEESLRKNINFKDAPPYVYLQRDLQQFIDGMNRV